MAGVTYPVESGGTTPPAKRETARSAPPGRRQRDPLGAVELLAVAAGVVIGALPSALTPPHLRFDSISFMESPFLHSYRLFLVPSIYWLLGHDYEAIIVFQAVVGAVCWTFLALEARRCARRPWSWVALLAVLLVECSNYVSFWYAAVLSESLSLSLLALLLATGLRWARGKGSVGWVVAAAWLWAFTRNTNGYLLVVVSAAGLATLAVPAWRSRRALLAWGATFLAGSLVVVASATTTGTLAEQPIEHVMLSRVLTDPQRTAWFASQGMPIDPEIRSLAGWTYIHALVLQDSPKLAGYRAWIDHSGERTYLEYAVTHPAWVVSGALGDSENISPRGMVYYTGGTKRPWYPAPLAWFLSAGRQLTLFALEAVALAGLAVVALWRRSAWRDRQLRWWAMVFATGILAFVGDWLGDSYEVARHEVGATVQIAVSALFLGAVCLAHLARSDAPRAGS